MDDPSAKPINAVEIARLALRMMADLGLAPTPANYAREYRRAAGLPPEAEDGTDADRSEEMIKKVDGLVQLVSETTSGLAVGVDRFDVESRRLMAEAGQVRHKDDFARLFQGLIASASSLQRTVANSREGIDATRKQLQQTKAEVHHSKAELRADLLTGECTREVMEELVAREIAAARNNREAFSVAIVEIDNLRKLAGEYGEEVGNKALAHLAAVAKACLRDADTVCRHSVREFVVLLPCADAEGARAVTGRLREMMEKTPLSLMVGRLVLRISAGVAEVGPVETAATLLKRAQQALTDAKAAGRNCVVLATAQ